MQNKSVGIFWIYQDNIYAKLQDISLVKPIKGFIDSDLAHYKVWEEIKSQHPKLYLYEYEDIPRGRVVYDVVHDKFLVYCYKKIVKNKFHRSLIVDRFALEDKVISFHEDEHYHIF